MRKVASRIQLIAINDKLKENLICIDAENKMCAFKEGHSDATVALEVGASANAVKLARIELFGKVKSFSKSAPNVKVQLDELTDRFNKLVTTLALNKVADVKHLAVTKLK